MHSYEYPMDNNDGVVCDMPYRLQTYTLFKWFCVHVKRCDSNIVLLFSGTLCTRCGERWEPFRCQIAKQRSISCSRKSVCVLGTCPHVCRRYQRQFSQ